jgi:hypothetical protein
MQRGFGGLCLRLDVDVNPSSHEVLNEFTPPMVRLIFNAATPRSLRHSQKSRTKVIDVTNGFAAGCEATALPRLKLLRSIWAVPLVWT